MNQTYRNILDAAARPYVPDELDLFPRIAARLERKTFMQTLRARPALAIMLAILVMLLLTGVAYAISRSLGYIPGVGLVQPASLRVLAEPVSKTREGVTVTIEQVVVDSERTVIVYRTEGLTIQAANSKGEGGGPFGSAHLLRLPDGTLLQERPFIGYNGTPEPLINNIQAEGGWPNYVWRIVFPSVESQINELTLLIPVLQNMPIGAAPENWEITFHLKLAPPDMTFVPVIEFTPQAEPATTGTPLAGATETVKLSNTSNLNGFTFSLDSVIEVEDGFVFTGSLSWADSTFPTGERIFVERLLPILSDGNGQNVPIEEVRLDALYDEHKMPWSIRTNRKTFSGPLVFSIPSIKTSVIAPPVDFEVDFGSNPQVGQTRDVNQDFVVEGHTIRLLSIGLTAVPNSCQGVGVEFKFSGDVPDAVVVSDVVPQEPIVCNGGGGGGGGGGPVDPTVFYGSVGYKNIPTGTHHFSISVSVPYVVYGPWQVTWNPPLTSEPMPTAETGACLTLDKWNQLADQNDALPPGVGGKILTTVNEGGLLPAIYVKSLDGANSQKIDVGAWPSLSNDGTHLVYSAADGLHVLDLASGQNSTLGTDGYRIIWSPDNTRMMYTTTFDLYVVNADGSGLQTIDTGSAQVISPVGWLSDNQTIVYGALGGDGFDFKSYNLQSGERKDLFTVHNKAGYGAISPDGQWLVFADRVFGADNWGIFISRLDGSDRKPVAAPDVPTAFTSVWGPTGQWLILNTRLTDGTDMPILVNPFTCQAERLSNIKGMVEAWSP